MSPYRLSIQELDRFCVPAQMVDATPLWLFDLGIRFKWTDPLGLQFAFT